MFYFLSASVQCDSPDTLKARGGGQFEQSCMSDLFA